MRNGVKGGEMEREGGRRNVKFVRLLGAVLNTGIINVAERRVLTTSFYLKATCGY